MKLVSWNVNGLRSILGKGLAAYIAAEQPDVLCLQEIKALPEQVTDWEIPSGYAAFWNPAQRKGYSGTMALSRLPVLDWQVAAIDSEGDAEGRCMVLEFERYFVVNVYTPNAKSDLSRLIYRTEVWDPAFRAYCSALAQRKPVALCGDLNVAHEEIDLANPRTNRNTAGFTDAERAAFTDHLRAGFVDTFRHFHPDQRGAYSWWSYRAGARGRNVGWRIDYVCVSPELLPGVSRAFIRPDVMGSDHCPVGIEL